MGAAVGSERTPRNELAFLLPSIRPPFAAMECLSFGRETHLPHAVKRRTTPVSRFNHRDGRADHFDDLNALVAENPDGLKVAKSPLEVGAKVILTNRVRA